MATTTKTQTNNTHKTRGKSAASTVPDGTKARAGRCADNGKSADKASAADAAAKGDRYLLEAWKATYGTKR